MGVAINVEHIMKKISIAFIIVLISCAVFYNCEMTEKGSDINGDVDDDSTDDDDAYQSEGMKRHGFITDETQWGVDFPCDIPLDTLRLREFKVVPNCKGVDIEVDRLAVSETSNGETVLYLSAFMKNNGTTYYDEILFDGIVKKGYSRSLTCFFSYSGNLLPHYINRIIPYDGINFKYIARAYENNSKAEINTLLLKFEEYIGPYKTSLSNNHKMSHDSLYDDDYYDDDDEVMNPDIWECYIIYE